MVVLTGSCQEIIGPRSLGERYRANKQASIGFVPPDRTAKRWMGPRSPGIYWTGPGKKWWEKYRGGKDVTGNSIAAGLAGSVLPVRMQVPAVVFHDHAPNVRTPPSDTLFWNAPVSSAGK